MGIPMPAAEELTYSLKGDKLIIEGGIPGVNRQSIELSYDKATDQISLNMDYAFDILGGIAQQIGDHYDQLEEINAQLGHRKEKKANINANQVSQGLKQLVGDVSPKWSKSGKCAPSTATEIQQSSTLSIDDRKEKEKQAGAEASRCADEFWKNSPESFCQALAEKCAEYSKDVYPDSKKSIIKSSLERDGYNKGFEYFDNSNEDGVGFCLAYKEVGGETILAVVIRGTCNGAIGDEWKGNMDIGTGNRHESFQQANVKVQEIINDYISGKNKEKTKLDNITFLVTGHSRGAGVANLLAVDLNDMTFVKNAKTKNVYCYTFATPNNATKFSEKGYENIFNFCFDDDFITQVPLKRWGYGKSGKTYSAVANGLIVTNPDFASHANKYGLQFNSTAVSNVIDDVYELANRVTDYNNPDNKLKMAPLTHIVLGIAYNVWKKQKYPQLPTYDPEESKTLHDFMKDYVAQATIDNDKGISLLNSSASIGLATKAIFKTGNDIHKIADFFVYINESDFLKSGAEKYIESTHDMSTYIKALENNGFCTLYLYRNQK